MIEQFKPGDVVEMKSGSPKLTVWFSSNDGWTHCFFFKAQTEAISHEVKLPTAVLKLSE
jgi:uncharacterized protein YodC (DUF2158 family)